MRFWTAAALCVALAGCFSSDEPVFEAARGQCPFTSPTHYFELEEDGAEKGRFTFETEGSYCKVTDEEDAEVTRVLFVPIGSNWWIVQGDEEKPSYILMRRSGDRLTQYLPRCQDFSASRLRRLEVSFDEDRRSCTVTNARQVETLFRSWRSPFRQAVGAFRRADE